MPMIELSTEDAQLRLPQTPAGIDLLIAALRSLPVSTTPRATYDKEAGAVYVYLSDKPYSSGTVVDIPVRLDRSGDGAIIGIEILGLEKTS